MSEISVDIWSLLLAASVVQGLLLFVLLFWSKTQRQPNRLLAFLILLIVWIQLEFLLVRSAVEWGFDLFYGTRHGVWLALGPLLFLYTQALTKEGFRLQRRHFLHLLPFVIFTLLIPLFFAGALPADGKYYGMLSVIRNAEMGLTALQMFYGFLFFLQFIHAGVYVVLGLRMLYRTQQNGNGVRLKTVRLLWVKRATGFMGIMLLVALIYFVVLFYSSSYERWMDYMLVLPTTALMYLLAFNAYKNPFLFRDDLKYALSQKKYAKSALSGERALAYEQQLKSLLSEDRVYRNPDIRLADLAEQLSAPAHELSQVINERFELSFNDLINGYRVEEAKALLCDDTNGQNMLEVAYAVGFNNKSSFNNYFKKLTGHTPTAFRKKRLEKRQSL